MRLYTEDGRTFGSGALVAYGLILFVLGILIGVSL